MSWSRGDDDDWRFRDPEPEPPLYDEEPEPPAWVRALAPKQVVPPPSPPLPAGFLKSLSEAEDALSRLDAATLAAPDAVREGIAARLAFREASGWLAHAQSWVHPLDLCLRDLGLTGSFLAAALGGRLRRELPATARSSDARGWTPEDPDTLPEDLSVGSALALARVLRRLATTSSWKPLASAAAMEAILKPLGGGIDPDAFNAWKANWKRETEVSSPLLAALSAAGRWGEVEQAAGASADWAERNLRAGLAAATALHAGGRLRAIPLPFWAVVPGRPVSAWRDHPGFAVEPAAAMAGLQRIAEASRAGLRELGQLLDAAQAAAEVTRGLDRRSKLPEAVEAVLRVPALTPSALARRLKIAQQTANDLLRQLAKAGIVREATGRKAFRAYAV